MFCGLAKHVHNWRSGFWRTESWQNETHHYFEIKSNKSFFLSFQLLFLFIEHFTTSFYIFFCIFSTIFISFYIFLFFFTWFFCFFYANDWWNPPWKQLAYEIQFFSVSKLEFQKISLQTFHFGMLSLKNN